VSLPLNLHPEVRREIAEAHDWYERRQLGLGKDFPDEVQAILTEITSNPRQYGFAEGNIREGLLKRFPYVVYYRVLADRIRVLAVYHTARDPARWQART
jgi:plasmid stabilization system protein ParE